MDNKNGLLGALYQRLSGQGLLNQPPTQGGGLFGALYANPLRQASVLNPPPINQWANDEMKFQQWARSLPWFSEFKQHYGEEPNLSPSANYDYRAAYRAGITPVRDEFDGNRYHWPSSSPDGSMLKSADHPTAWKEHYMRMTGKNPDAVGATLEDFKKMQRR